MTFTWEPRPEAGLDCQTCVAIARQLLPTRGTRRPIGCGSCHSRDATSFFTTCVRRPDPNKTVRQSESCCQQAAISSFKSCVRRPVQRNVTPPWSRVEGKCSVNFQEMLPDAGSILRGVHFWGLPFALMLSPGKCLTGFMGRRCEGRGRGHARRQGGASCRARCSCCPPCAPCAAQVQVCFPVTQRYILYP